jgi:hypothetical protein
MAITITFNAAADPFALVICGSGGDEEFTDRFSEWGTRLYGVLTHNLGFEIENVSLLMDGEDSDSSLESIQNALGTLGDRIAPEDDLFVFMIGHGSHLSGISKINVPGPDVSADALDEWFTTIAPRRLVVINTASSSAGFINVLSAPNRIICTATKSIEEKNATVFMQYFIDGIEDGSADLNRDTRISVYEACEQAAILTRAWYESEGLIATEHALLDDNGDRRGSRLAEPDDADTDEDSDGELATRSWLRDFSFPPEVPKDLIDQYLANLDAVEELKARKESIDPAAYREQLEEHLINAARANAAIRKIAAEPTLDVETVS